MKLKVKLLGIESGKPTVVMDDEYASRLGLHPSDRGSVNSSRILD